VVERVYMEGSCPSSELQERKRDLAKKKRKGGTAGSYKRLRTDKEYSNTSSRRGLLSPHGPYAKTPGGTGESSAAGNMNKSGGRSAAFSRRHAFLKRGAVIEGG